MTLSPAPIDADTHAPESESRSLARDSVGTTLTNGALFLLGIVIWVTVARLLDPTWRGVLALIMVAPGAVIRIGMLGMDQGMVVLGGADRSKLGVLTRTGVVYGLLAGILLMALLLGFMWLFPMAFWRITQLWLPRPFMAITLVFPVHLMTMAYDAAVYAEDRIAARNAKELAISAIMLVIMFYGFFAWRLQLYGVIGAYLLANVVSLAYGWFLVRGRVPLSGAISIDLAKRAVKLGFPIYLAQLAAYVMLPCMMILLALVLPGEPTKNLARIAFFTMGYQMVDRILPVTRSVAFALLPKITGGTEESARELAAKASRHTLLASLVLLAVLVIFMKPIVAILLGKRYLPVVGAFAIMAPGGVALSVAGVWAAHLLARRRPLQVARAGISGVLVALVLAGLGFWLGPEGREVLVASVCVVIGNFVHAALLLPTFCSVAGLDAGDALVPRLADLQEWRRIPGFIGEYIKRLGVRFQGVDGTS